MKKKRFFKIKRSHQLRLTQFLIALICILLLTLGGATPHLNSAVSNLANSPAETESLVQEGRKLYEAGQSREAIAILLRAVANFRATGDKLREAMTWSNLSLAYQQLGQWQEAEEAIKNSLNLLQRDNSSEKTQILAQALDIQGRLQFTLSKTSDALTSWQQAARIYKQMGDEAGIIRSRINSVSALQTLGLYRQAQKTLNEITQLLQNQPDSTLKAEGLLSLGNVLRVSGDLKAARKILEQSLAVAKKSQSKNAIAEAFIGLGNTARAQKDNQGAIKFYQEAAATPTDAIARVQAQLNQLNLLIETEQWESASEFWRKIKSEITQLTPSHRTVYTQIVFAQSLIKLAEKKIKNTPSREEIAQLLAKVIEEAKNLGDRRATSYALGNLAQLYEQSQQWSEAIDSTEQALFLAQTVNASDIVYRWEWQLGRLLKQQGDIKGAIASYTQAFNNLQSLRSDLVSINSDIQFSFREEVEPVYRQLVDLLLSSETDGENLKQARQVIESLQLAELVNFFRENCIVVKQADFVDKKAAIIYPILLEDRLEVIVSIPGQNLRHYGTKIRPEQVEKIVEELRQNLILPYTSEQDILPLSQQIYNWLIQPVRSTLDKSGIKTLVFVLDGSLRNIPMAALHDGSNYLVEKYSIALSPGLQLLKPIPLVRTQLKGIIAGLTKSRFGFGSLEYVKKELTEIGSEIPTEILLDREFTSTNLDNEVNSSSVPVVHIATHGQFSSKADETFILAWDRPIKVKQLDDLLSKRDENLESALELLVLSACETANGDKRAALGLAGVALRAGARSTLASLWLVDDESTALLMTHFYQELKTGVTKGEALRRAQQTLLNGNYKHPRFWAAFVLLGNWL